MVGMRKLSLDALADQQLKRAAEASAGRSATTVYGGHEHTLRQTLIAMTDGTSLADHPSPGESTLFVLRGRVRLTSGEEEWEGRTGDMLIIPRAMHALHALADSAVILTVAMER